MDFDELVHEFGVRRSPRNSSDVNEDDLKSLSLFSTLNDFQFYLVDFHSYLFSARCTHNFHDYPAEFFATRRRFCDSIQLSIQNPNLLNRHDEESIWLELNLLKSVAEAFWRSVQSA